MSVADKVWAAQAQIKPRAIGYRINGRSFWVARYRQRDDIYEWDCDWSLIPRTGLIEVRLVCPNGQIAVLGNTADASDRLFQLKIAQVGLGGHFTRAQVIGRLDGLDGEATLWAWEYLTGQLVGPIIDNVAPGRCRYDAALSFPYYDVLGVKAD